MKVSRLSYAFVLGLLLVLAQLGGSVHALTHVQDSASQEQQKHPAGQKVCDQCLAFATIGGAAKSHAPQFAVADGRDEIPCYAFLSVASREATPYQSRAPPIRS